jgi:hypothetical protein
MKPKMKEVMELEATPPQESGGDMIVVMVMEMMVVGMCPERL